ncbi:L-asparaginase [Klebsiella pneumoniae]|nr:L-asparaginase [Klebsiella pneumoniae]
MGKAVIAIHGGAGAISRAQMTPEREREYVAALSTIVESGQKMLAAGASALDAVTEAVRLLEECPLFNAGMGRGIYPRSNPRAGRLRNGRLQPAGGRGSRGQTFA